MEKFLGKGYHLYTDNFYNSFKLTKHMISQNTYICGTLRTDRKSNPKECTKAKLKRGDVISRSREGVVIATWKDKRDMLMISNLHSLQMIEVTNRRGEKKMKPNIIKDYNQYMSGVDKADQTKVALHLFDIFVLNAYCLSSKHGVDKTTSFLKFRELVVTDLLGDRLNEIVPRITNNSLHYLSSIPPNEKKKLPTKPCRVCSKIKRKETRYECAVCENRPPLCVGECFRMYHSKE
nr:piggyBac transposable element-derived protein 4-like [Hydra vulgaris]